MDLVVSDSLIFYWKMTAFKSDSISALEYEKYQEASRMNVYLNGTIEEEKRKSRLLSIGVGVGGTLLGVLLGVLLR